MKQISLIQSIIFSVLVFITFGEVILPYPLNQASINTRLVINEFLIGLFPDGEFTTVQNRHSETIINEYE